MKLFSILAVALLGAQTFASYELMLVVDQETNYISRYDPVTGTFLGTFGGLQLINPQSVALIPGTSDCLVTDFSTQRIHRFNYSTGQFISAFDNPFITATTAVLSPFSDGTFLLWSYNANIVHRINATGTLLNSFSVPVGASTICGAGVGSSNEVFIAWNGINKIQRYAANGTVQGQSAAFASSFGTGAQMVVSGSYGYFTTSGNTVVKFATGNPAIALESVALTAGDASYRAARGHGDLTYFSGKNSGVTPSIWVYDGVKKVRLGRFTPIGVTTPVSMAIVVAPEPGTLLALAGGLAWIGRRRKARTA